MFTSLSMQRQLADGRRPWSSKCCSFIIGPIFFLLVLTPRILHGVNEIEAYKQAKRAVKHSPGIQLFWGGRQLGTPLYVLSS